MKYLKRFESLKENLAKRIANELGEEIYKYLGGGAFGVAYSTKSGKVIKLTSDKSEFLLAYRLVKNKKWMKCLINFYNVGKIFEKSQIKDPYIYYILMDQVLPLSDIEKLAISSYYSVMNSDNHYEKLNDLESIIEKIPIRGMGLQIREKVRELYPYVRNISTELKKHKIGGTDFHSGNVGWDKTKQNLVLFDISTMNENGKITSRFLLKN